MMAKETARICRKAKQNPSLAAESAATEKEWLLDPLDLFFREKSSHRQPGHVSPGI
jgi:hypothetical protein